MKLYLRLAWRNIWRHRRRTWVVVLAMGLTMAMMMFYDGFLAGFETDIYANAIKVLGGNIQIHAAGYSDRANKTPLLPLPDDQAAVTAARAQPETLNATRRINTSGMATNPEGAFGVQIIGIEPEGEQPTNLVAQHVVAGRYLTGNDQDMAFIGQGLAEAMSVGVGDRFTLAGKSSHGQMRSRTMTVAGIYDVGLPDVEKSSLYISLAEAQDLYDLPGQSTEVVISLHRVGPEPQVIQRMNASLPGYEMSSWQTNFPEMVAAVTRKTAAMDVFSIIILGVAGIGIFNMLMMSVYERTREIGVLGALGVKPPQISWLFLLEGIMIGLVGIAFGAALGLLTNFALGRVGFDFSAFSQMTSYTALLNSRVYPSLGLESLPKRAIPVLIIAIFAAFYPAYEASRNEPAEALHYV